MGRPAFGQDQSTVGLFKIGPDGVTAERTQVKLGKSSVNTIEVLSGLKVGDQVILSDMELFRTLNESGTTIVQVTHSEVNASYGTRIIQLRDGWVVED